MQRDESVDGERLPVSSYVFYLFVIKSGLEVIADLAHRLMAESNPSMDGFYFEWLLLVSISQCVVTLHGAKKEEAVHLPKAPILMFDPKKRFRREEDRKLYSGVITKCHEDDTYDIEYEGGKKVTRVPVELISLPVKEGGCDIKLKVNDEVKARLKPNIKGNQRWLRPMLVYTKCNQGSYDAVYFDMEAGKVIFLQATRSDTHNFKMIFVQEVLLKLESAGMKISDVEVFFVTMKDQLWKFNTGNVHERYALQKYWTSPEEKHAKVRYLDIQIPLEGYQW